MAIAAGHARVAFVAIALLAGIARAGQLWQRPGWPMSGQNAQQHSASGGVPNLDDLQIHAYDLNRTAGKFYALPVSVSANDTWFLTFGAQDTGDPYFLGLYDQQTSSVSAWFKEAGGVIGQPTIAADGTVFTCFGSKVYALSSDLQVLWTAAAHCSNADLLLNNDDTMLFLYTMSTSTLVAFDIGQRKVAWSQSFPNTYIRNGFALSEDGSQVYVTVRSADFLEGTLLALSAATGEHRWKKTCKNPGGTLWITAPAAGCNAQEPMVYFACGTSLVALHAADSSAKWLFEGPTNMDWSQPAVYCNPRNASDVRVVASQDTSRSGTSSIFSIDATSGAPMATIDINNVKTDFVLDGAGTVYAWNSMVPTILGWDTLSGRNVLALNTGAHNPNQFVLTDDGAFVFMDGAYDEPAKLWVVK